MIRNIAICIPLNQSFLVETKELYNELEKNFGLSFMKEKLSRPHINLCSGSTSKLPELQKKISNIKFLKKNRKIFYLGMAMFLRKKITFYLRFSSEKIFLDLRNSFLEYSDIWIKLEDTVKNNMWIPKSTIIHNDLSFKDDLFLDVLNFLNSWKFSQKSFEMNEISLIDFKNIEHEVFNFKI